MAPKNPKRLCSRCSLIWGLGRIPVATAKSEGEAFFIQIGIPWAVFITINPRLHDPRSCGDKLKYGALHDKYIKKKS